MKKKIIATITMLCLLTVLYNYLRLPDYHITNSISFSSADTRDTELTVIVYKCWKINYRMGMCGTIGCHDNPGDLPGCCEILL